MTTNPSENETTREVSMNGMVCEVDRYGMTFHLQLSPEVKVPAPIPERHLDTVLTAFKSRADGVRVTVRGIGRCDRQLRVLSFDAIMEVVLHGPPDVLARLEEFRDLQDGWADGIQHPSTWGSGYGKAPSHQGLNWLADKFTSEYPDDLPLPHTYPTPEGGVQMEWDLGRFDAELEVNLDSHEGELRLWLDLTPADAEDKRWNLDDSDSWAYIASSIRRMKLRLMGT